MEASIGEPFVLSTYGISQKSSKSGKVQQRSSADVFATHHKASGSSSSSSEGYVTATVRGDGVHVLDLATLHPIISHTLGPTTTFSCPSITQSEHQGTDHICTTYAAISSSPDIPEEEHQKTIWMWKENLSSSIADRAAQKKKRKSIALPHTISRIYASDELPSRLIVVSSEEGNLTLVDKDLLQIRNTKALNSRVLKYFVLPRQKCSFVPSRNAPVSGIVVVSLLVSEESVRVNVLVVDSDDGYTDLGDLSLDLDATKIHTASCSLSGFFSVLLKDGSWNMFEFKSSNDTSSLSLTPLSEHLQLSPSLGFTPTSSSQKTQKTTNSISILSLGSSHVLLAGLTHQTNEIALLFWDLQFSVLLASRTIPAPASLSEGGGGGGSVSVTLVDGLSSSNVLLVLTPNALPPPPPTSDRRKSQNKSATAAAGAGGVARSSVFVVPVTVPLVSSIANAMGRAADGEKWVVSVRDGALGVNNADADAGGAGAGAGGGGGYDAGRKKVIEEMRVAIEQGRPQNANEVFFEWEKCEGEVEREGESGDKDVDVDVDGAGAGSGSGDADVEPEGDKKKVDQKVKKPTERPSTPEFGYNFVKDILNVILQPSKPPNTPYSSQVIEYLLQKKVVSAAMVEPGLLAVLRLRNDWKSINIALTAVPDLEEKEIIESLRFVLLRHRHRHRQAQSNSNASDAMQVDSTTTTNETETETETIPSLPSFLTTILRTKTSPIPLRLALKRYIPDVEDVLCVLEVLDSWIAQWAGREVRLLPSNKMMGKNEFGVLVVKSGEGMFRGGGGESDIPSLMQITSFLQSLLDTSFINLVQHAPAHRILKKIASQVDPEIKYIDQMAQLRGPLEVFVRAQNKAVRDAKAVSEGVQVPLVDWRQRKKLAHEQAGMAIGLYQLEELVL